MAIVLKVDRTKQAGDHIELYFQITNIMAASSKDAYAITVKSGKKERTIKLMSNDGESDRKGWVGCMIERDDLRRINGV